MSQNDYGMPAEVTAQSLFNKVADHLIRQGRKSFAGESEFNCAYRSPDGAACAFGCLISDAEYDNSMEGLGLLQLVEEKKLSKETSDTVRVYLELLSFMQLMHDTAILTDDGGRFEPFALERALESVAVKHGLTFTQVVPGARR